MEMGSYSKHVKNMNSMKILWLLIIFVRDVCHIIYIDKYSNIMNIYKYGIKIVLQYIINVYFICWNSFGYYYIYKFILYY